MKSSELLAEAIASSGKRQKQIAEECGFSKPNIITMMKQGKTNIPFGRIPAIAKSTGLDPRVLLTHCLREHKPELLQAIRDVYGINTEQFLLPTNTEKRS